MILKKEQIANEKIKCYVSKNNKNAIVKIGTKSFEVDLKNVKEIPVSCELDEFSNYLLKINRMLIDLKLNNEDIKNSEITIVTDNESFVKFMKPEGILLQKTSKSLKKSIDNVEFKRTLGITLYELSTFENIDLIFEEFLQKEGYNMSNNNNDFNYTEDDTNFDLNMDISSLNDIINVSELDYNEDDLFKEFDLDTNVLFDESSSDDFIFQAEELENKKDNDSNDFVITSKDEFAKDTVLTEENFDFDISLNDESNAFSNDDFNLNEDEILFTDDSFKIEDDFTFTNNDTENPVTSTENIEENSKEFLTSEYKTEEVTEEFLIFENTTDETSNNISLLEEDINMSIFEEKEEEKTIETNLETSKIEDNINLEVINKENTEIKGETEVTNTIEENSYDTISNCKENDREFIEKELIDLKNILEKKIDSYKDKIVEFNSKYEEKHLALKDLNLRDEARQLEIFKEFLDCKSTIISLNELNNTCNSIILDIDNKISEIKK